VENVNIRMTSEMSLDRPSALLAYFVCFIKLSSWLSPSPSLNPMVDRSIQEALQQLDHQQKICYVAQIKNSCWEVISKALVKKLKVIDCWLKRIALVIQAH